MSCNGVSEVVFVILQLSLSRPQKMLKFLLSPLVLFDLFRQYTEQSFELGDGHF